MQIISRFPRREDVERSNSTRMNQLSTEQEIFHSLDGGAIQDAAQREKMLANFMAPQRLTLRIGAQVMLIKNVDDMLVNGSMGKVLRFVDPAVYGTQDDPESNPGAGVVGGTSSTTAGGGAAKKHAAALGARRYPVVDFDLPNGIKRRMLVMPEAWTVELPSGEIQVSRSQVCLTLNLRRPITQNSIATANPFLGNEYTQVSRANIGARQGGSG
jgi:ATP-dependent DNA helicase PIF1